MDKFFWYLLHVEKLKGCVSNSLDSITRPKLPERLTNYREIQRFLEAALQNRSLTLGMWDYCLIRFLGSSGLRITACLGLTLEKVHYRDGYPHSIRYVDKGNKEREKVLTEGVALDVISDVLDHSSIQTTQIYAKVGNEELEQALNEFPNVM